MSVVRAIDTLSDWSGRLFCWLIVPLIAGTTYEVIVRYLFNAPTIWAYDLSYMLYGAHFMLGAGYTLLKGGHIRTDIFYQNWSPRTRGLVDALLYLLFFFPGMIFFFWMGGQEALHSILIGERSDASPWRPIVYPLKTVLPVTALLILIQGVSEFIKSVHLARYGRSL
jgi:TRAP-type mannitol/chloroaromatic compound transport system permease small subunit